MQMYVIMLSNLLEKARRRPYGHVRYTRVDPRTGKHVYVGAKGAKREEKIERVMAEAAEAAVGVQKPSLPVTDEMLGWWALGEKLYEVSAEGGGGDHIGFLFAIENRGLFDISKEDVEALAGFYYQRDEEAGGVVTNEVTQAFRKVWESGAIRIAIFGKELVFDMPDTAAPAIRRAQDAVVALPYRMHANMHVTIENFSTGETLSMPLKQFQEAKRGKDLRLSLNMRRNGYPQVRRSNVWGGWQPGAVPSYEGGHMGSDPDRKPWKGHGRQLRHRPKASRTALGIRPRIKVPAQHKQRRDQIWFTIPPRERKTSE